MRGARGRYSEDILSLKNLNIQDDNIPYRIRVVGSNYKFIDEQYFQTTKDKDPYDNYRYKITAYYDEDNDYEKSLSLHTNSTLTQNVHFGINEFRIRAVGKNGLRSEHLMDSIYITSRGMEKLYLLFCYDVMQDYFNEYISEVLLKKGLLTEFEMDELVEELLLMITRAIEDEKELFFDDNLDVVEDKKDIDIEDIIVDEVEELLKIVIDDLISLDELLDDKMKDDMFYYFLYELGEDLANLKMFDNKTENFFEKLIEDRILEVASENITLEIIKDDKKIEKIIGQFQRVVVDKMKEIYLDFKVNDIALLAIEEMIEEFFVFYNFGEDMFITLSDDLTFMEDGKVNNFDEIKSFFNETVDILNDAMKVFSDVDELIEDDNAKYFIEYILEDLFCGSYIAGKKEIDFDFKIFDQNKIDFKRSSNGPQIIKYDKDNLGIAINGRWEDIVRKQVIKNDIDTKIHEMWKIPENLNLPIYTFEILNFIEFFDDFSFRLTDQTKILKGFNKVKSIDDFLIKVLESLDISPVAKDIKNNEEIDLSPNELVTYWKYRFIETMSYIYEKMAKEEEMSMDIAAQIIDDEVVDLEFRGNESITVKFGGSLGMLPGEEALSRMGLMVLGAFELGKDAIGSTE